MRSATRGIVLFFLAPSFPLVSSLSTNYASKTRQKAIERVAVVGAGISGLSLAHALKNSPSLSDGSQASLEVSIFDSRKSLDYTAGSGVQLNGGIAVLGKINPAVQKAVIDAAVPIGELRGRNKSWAKENSVDKLWDISIEKMFRNAGGRAVDELIIDGTLMWFGIMRGALQVRLGRVPTKSFCRSF
jgi:hypothetical protein